MPAPLAPVPGLPLIGSSAGLPAAAPAAISAGFVFNAVLIGASIATSLLESGPGRPPPEAQGFSLRENPVDPKAPPLVIYGRPWVRPPKASHYVLPEELNTLHAAKKQRIVRVWDTGYGPHDGRDLRLKSGGEVLFDVVDETSPDARRQLQPIDDDFTEYIFPVENVDLSSVQVFADGELIAVGPDFNGGTTDTPASTTITEQLVARRTWKNQIVIPFVGNDVTEWALTTSTTGVQRFGGYVPTGGEPDQETAVVEVFIDSHLFTWPHSKKRASYGWNAVPRADLGFGKDADGARYFWFFLGTHINFPYTQIRYSGEVGKLLDLRLNSAGRLVATFTESQEGKEVTASFRTKLFDDGYRYVFRKGDVHQDAVGIDDTDTAARNPTIIGAELDQFVTRKHSTAEEVDDVIVTIESGADGFFAQDKEGRFGPIARTLQLRIKESSAPDKIGEGTDLSSGWIDVKHPLTRDTKWEIRDQLTGIARWFFSFADLYAFTRDGKIEGNAAHSLPRKKYDVSVTALNPANANNRDQVDEQRFHSTLFLAAATEVIRSGFVLPGRSTIVDEIDSEESLDPDALFEVQFAARKVWVPDPAAVYDADTGRPEPGARQWSANPVWCACDHIVDKRSGGGRHYDWSQIDLPRALAAAAYCDELVARSGNDATLEARSEVDIGLGAAGSRAGFFSNLSDILAGSGVLVSWSGVWRFLIDEDGDVAQDPVAGGDFTIVEATDAAAPGVSMEVREISDIPTELRIDFPDEERDFDEDHALLRIDDPQPTDRFEQTVRFPGVRRRTQVERAGTVMLEQFRRNLRGYRVVAAGWRLALPEPGDLVRVTAARCGAAAKLCRVVATGIGSDKAAALVLQEHDPDAYKARFMGPVGGVLPGTRPPSSSGALPRPVLIAEQLVVERVAEGTGA